MNILYEDRDIIVCVKDPGVPSQSDKSRDMDMVNMLRNYVASEGLGGIRVGGMPYIGLVHRLDRPVGGIMVFAKTSKAASRLSEQVRTHKLNKVYYAVVDGDVKNEDRLVDKLLKDHKTNITKVSKDGKESILEYKKIGYKDNFSLVKINLITGRSHQIRVQFSSRNHALYGDQKYNKNTKKDNIALFAKQLSFYHPTTQEFLTFELDLPNRYPFNIF